MPLHFFHIIHWQNNFQSLFGLFYEVAEFHLLSLRKNFRFFNVAVNDLFIRIFPLMNKFGSIFPSFGLNLDGENFSGYYSDGVFWHIVTDFGGF